MVKQKLKKSHLTLLIIHISSYRKRAVSSDVQNFSHRQRDDVNVNFFVDWHVIVDGDDILADGDDELVDGDGRKTKTQTESPAVAQTQQQKQQ